MILKPGVYENLPRAEYDAIEAMNFSRLKYMERSPMAFRHNCDHPTPPTPPMVLGNAAHLAILEPGMADFAIWPGPGRRFGKEWDAFCYENQGKTLLNVKERDHVVGMTLAVHANPVAHKYLRFIKTEVTLVWRDPSYNRDFKARIDAVTDIGEEPVLVSLKSTADCRDFRFGAQYHKMGYFAQDAIYQSGFWYLNHTLPRMVTVAVESKPPYESAVYNISTDICRAGQQAAQRWLIRLAECEQTNTWPGAVEGEQDLVLPSWAIEGDFSMDDLEPIER